jgi:hypothetical protein
MLGAVAGLPAAIVVFAMGFSGLVALILICFGFAFGEVCGGAVSGRSPRQILNHKGR